MRLFIALLIVIVLQPLILFEDVLLTLPPVIYTPTMIVAARTC
jgi:hypothetical protein